MAALVERLNHLGQWLFENLWQLSIELAVLALVVLGAIRLLRIRSPRLRHLFWCLVLVKPVATLLVASPISIYWYLRPAAEAEAPPPPAISPAPKMVVALERPLAALEPRALPETKEAGPIPIPPHPKITSPLEPAITVASPLPAPADPRLDIYGAGGLVWLMVALALGFRMAAGSAFVSYLRWKSAFQREGPLADLAAEASKALKMRRRVAVAISDLTQGPVLTGIFWPVILMPGKMARELPPEHLKRILAHELAHARRWDNLILLMQRMVEMFLFFHPVVWLSGFAIRREAEEACDDAVLGAFGESAEYADSLTRVAELGKDLSRPLLVDTFAAAESNFTRRVVRILENRAGRMTLRLTVASVSVLAVVAALGLPSAAQRVESGTEKEKSEQPARIFEGTKTIIFEKVAFRPRKIVLTDPQEVAKIVEAIQLKPKEPCACDHIESATFVTDSGEVRVSLCDHCFDVESDGKTIHYAMPADFYELFDDTVTFLRTKEGAPRLLLEGQDRYVEGQRVVIRYRYAASEWKSEYREDRWSCHLRINGIEYKSRVGLEPFSKIKRAGYLDLCETISYGRERDRFQPGKYRVVVAFKDIDTVSPKSVHFDELASEQFEFEVFSKDSPEAKKIRTGAEYEGKTIAEWVNEFATISMGGKQQAAAALARIGKPAVPALMRLIEEGDPRAHWANRSLGDMGEEAREALPRLLELAKGEKPLEPSSGDSRTAQWYAVYALGEMEWAAGQSVPVLKEVILESKGEERRMAILSLGNLGGAAVPVLRELYPSGDAEERKLIAGALDKAYTQSGEKTGGQIFRELIEADPFDPNVPRYLPRTKYGAVSAGRTGRSHPLSQKIKALYRERLREAPDPQVARSLASIIQCQLINTDFQWSTGAQEPWKREDPAENYASLANVLEVGFRSAAVRSDLWRTFGTGLAKLRLLQGDWEGMNAMLVALGEQPIPGDERPWLHAPPKDWRNLRAKWRLADPHLRTGGCGMALQFEKDGKGLQGVHVLVKEAPKPQGGGFERTGRRADTLFHETGPFDDGWLGTFGYVVDKDRAQTRYAVSDATGVIRLEGLPEMEAKLEVLIPASNFPEAVRGFDLLMEVEPGNLVSATNRGQLWPLLEKNGLTRIQLKYGEVFQYPKFVVRPQMAAEMNVSNWDQVDPQNFILEWAVGGAADSTADVTYELELSLSVPAEHPGMENLVPVLKSGKVKTGETRWPIGEQGVDGLRLAPGNLYLLEVKALKPSGELISRLPRTLVWTPWPNRKSEPPYREFDMVKQSPIHHGSWWRGSYSGHLPEGKEENLQERLDRYLRDYPDAFEHEYARVGRAWLDWHHKGLDVAKKELEQLLLELPQGNVARDTAAWLLQELKLGKEPGRRLNFVTQ